MALPTSQYRTFRDLLRIMLSIEGVGPSDGDVMSFFKQLLADASGATPLSSSRNFLCGEIFRRILSGNASNPTDADVVSFWTQFATDSSAAVAMGQTVSYQRMRQALRGSISCDGLSPTDADVLGYFAVYAGALRFIATRAQVPDLTQNALFSLMSRTGHFARDNITSIKIAWANWCADGTLLNITSNVMSIAASIEYPSGTFTQVKFSAATTGSANPFTTLWSDFASVVIPNGAEFWVRTWQTGTAGIVFHSVPKNTTILEASSFPGSNQTMSGSVTDTASQIYGPCAIVGRTSKKTVYIVGDSRQNGATDTGLSAIGGWGEMNNGLDAYAYSVNAQSGTTTAGYLGIAGALQTDLAQYATDVVSAFGINDLNSITSSQLVTNQGSIRALFPTARFHVTTLAPSTTSTDSWATLVNQTPAASNAQRVVYNTAVRLNALGYDPAYDCAAVAESSLNSGKWQVDGTANKYSIDGLHQSVFCYGLYASAGFTL
jgi:hypothetical protein